MILEENVQQPHPFLRMFLVTKCIQKGHDQLNSMPIMEYASIVWDPYQVTYINNLERIQRRAARWATSKYSRLSNVSNLLESLKWPALELCHKIAILSFFHKIMYSSSPVDLPSYFDIINRPTHQCHPLYMVILYTATSAYQGSFFP